MKFTVDREGGPMHAERRKHSRVKPDPGFVCTCTNAEFSGHSRDPYNLATRLLDVSARGACLVTPGRLRERVPLILDLCVPQMLARFKARAVVRWSRTLERGGRTAHLAGLHFERVLETYGDRLAFLGGRKEAPSPMRGRDPQRRFRRFLPRDARVTCVARGFWNSLGFRSNPALGLHDVSQGGAQVLLSKRLLPGRVVDVTLDFGPHRATVAAEALVRWCRRDTRSLESRWNAGLVFRRMAPDHEEQLKILEALHLG